MSGGRHTGGGKSECYKTLQGALNLLHQTQGEDTAHVPVNCFCLNPKSISLGELYGAYNPVSNDWKDGVASKLVREAMADGTHAMKWLVFDGPVDAVWVENLNTVSASPIVLYLECMQANSMSCYNTRSQLVSEMNIPCTLITAYSPARPQCALDK